MPTFIKSNVDATVNVNSEAIQSADYNYSDEALQMVTNTSTHEYHVLPFTAYKSLQVRVNLLTTTLFTHLATSEFND